MGNVTLPTPVALAGGSICILGGYLLGVLAGPDTPTRTTATVESYDEDSGRLCLTGDTVEEQEGAVDGMLCGSWRRTEGSGAQPSPGDEFRFVSLVVDQPEEGEEPTDDGASTIIYGDVVR